ncbi:advillin isoform X2 [Onthophagus taurus]|uniref:advillin isoform X2 n=1 Tax=Onthophagus taurus TaxID=166361 RepID=UPI0039BDB372
MQVLDIQQADYDDAYSNGTTSNGTVVVDAAFKKVPKSSAGFHIWRIENMNVVALGRNQYGTFYDDDSYVILAASLPGQSATIDSVTREIRGGLLEYHIHFWLGGLTTPDKSGVAAYKTVELDGYLGGCATQHRETQGNESARFRSYFKNGFRVLKSHAEQNGDSLHQIKLYKIKGKRNPVVVQQESVSWKYFNSGDVFVLLTPTIIFVWVGRAANSIEKLHATKIAVQLKSENDNIPLVFVDDGYEQSLQNEQKSEFQKYLPLNQRHVLPSDPEKDEVVEKQFKNNIKLYKCSDNNGKYRVTEIKSGPLLQSDLDSDDVFILDHGLFGIWVWVGKRANDKERTEAMRNARGFVKKKKYANETSVTRVVDGAEPKEFKMLFVSWRQKDSQKAKIITNGAQKNNQKIAITKFDAVLMHERPSLAAETQLLDDGTGTSRIWKIRKNDSVEIGKEKFGNFFSGDCYLIWYSYQSQGQKHILYTWFGLHASDDEMLNTFSKRTEIENELGGQAIKVRVIQGREPPQLLQIFKGKLVIFRGKGTEQDESGRNTKSPTNYLLHVQGSATYNSKATQVNTKSSSLNSNYCFVLKKSKKYFVWSGINSTGDQREMAKHFTGKDFELVLEGKEPQEFWDLLGGKAEYFTTKIAIEENDLKCPRLFHFPNITNHFKIEEVFNFAQSDLTPEDIMLLDAFSTIFIWIGALSTTYNRKNSLEMALEYLRNDPAGRDMNIPIIEVKQGNEPPNFIGFFPNWNTTWWAEHVAFEEMRSQLEGVKIEKKLETTNGNHVENNDFDCYEKYPVKMLKESMEKLPNKVDPLQKELHLTHDDFVFLFKMKYEEFKNLPRWKQQELKKKVGLF